MSIFLPSLLGNRGQYVHLANLYIPSCKRRSVFPQGHHQPRPLEMKVSTSSGPSSTLASWKLRSVRPKDSTYSGSSSTLASCPWKQRSVRPLGQPLPRLLKTEVSIFSGPSSVLASWQQRSVRPLGHPLSSLLGNRGQYVLWVILCPRFLATEVSTSSGSSSVLASWKQRSVRPLGDPLPILL